MKWAARFTSGGVQGWVVEHSYTRGAGKSRRTFTHTMVAVPVPVSWAMTSVTRPTILTIVKGWMGTKDMQLDSAVFNKAFHITTSDENFALVLLTPEVQEWMLAAPRNWNFCVSQGLLRVYAPQTAAAKVLPALLDAPSELLARTTPELFLEPRPSGRGYHGAPLYPHQRLISASSLHSRPILVAFSATCVTF